MAKTDLLGHPVPFSGTAVTCDLERKTGGEKFQFENAVLCPNASSKKAFHHAHGVINIKLLTSNVIRSIQPILMTIFNGQKVYL